MQRPDSSSLLQVVQLDKTQASAAPEPVYASDRVGPGKRVTLHFSLTLENGKLIDSCFDKAPASFIVGDGSMLPGFERSLFGLAVGASHEACIPPAQAFGLPNADNVQGFPRYRFPADLPLCEGLLIDFADSAGNSQAGVVRKFDSARVEIDFNHPLAGKSIVFSAKVLGIEPGV